MISDPKIDLNPDSNIRMKPDSEQLKIQNYLIRYLRYKSNSTNHQMAIIVLFSATNNVSNSYKSKYVNYLFLRSPIAKNMAIWAYYKL